MQTQSILEVFMRIFLVVKKDHELVTDEWLAVKQ